jgi:hypothetical protein
MPMAEARPMPDEHPVIRMERPIPFAMFQKLPKNLHHKTTGFQKFLVSSHFFVNGVGDFLDCKVRVGLIKKEKSV